MKRMSANIRNRQDYEAAIASATQTSLAHFLSANFDPIEQFCKERIPKLDLDVVVDLLHGKGSLENQVGAREFMQKILTAFVRNEDISALKPYGLQLQPREADTHKHMKQVRHHGHRLVEDLQHLAAAPVKALWHTLNLAGHGYAALTSSLGIGTIGHSLIGATALAGIGATVLPDDFNPLRKIPEIAIGTPEVVEASLAATPEEAPPVKISDLHPACRDLRIFNTDSVTAAFAVAYSNQNTGKDIVYRATLNAALTHGIAPEAPFYIAAYETNGFRDLIANNSSATNPWQMIDATKFAYIKAYGEQTRFYLDAKERLENGISQLPDRDRLIVNSIETIITASQSKLDEALAAKRFSVLQFAALRLADDISFAAELVALDIRKKAPALHIENVTGLSAAERLQLTAGYYAPDHFLGATNMRLAAQLQLLSPDTRLTDAKQVSRLIGAEGAQRLNGVVTRNPGLLPPDITAGRLIPRITEYFSAKLEKMTASIDAQAAGFKTAFDLCAATRMPPVQPAAPPPMDLALRTGAPVPR